MLSARIGEDRITRIDAQAEGRTTTEGKPMGRTDAVKLAVDAWLGSAQTGAIFATEREQRIVNGIRRLSLERPLAAEGVYLLAESALEGEEAADAIERLIPLIREFRRAAPPPGGAAPKDSRGGGRRKSG